MTSVKIVSVLLLIALGTLAQDDFLYGTFPAGFLWGVSTSAYQTEGAWNVNGKGVHIWDTVAHMTPCVISNCATGDVATNSYYQYPEDIAALKELGVHFYRFSLSWTRILPTGRTDNINQDGIDFYNRMIDGLLAEGITPLVTLYHWDMPQTLQDEYGGMLGEQLVDDFGQYAALAFTRFGDRVKNWITFNEPYVICVLGYGYGAYAPLSVNPGIGEYMCGHNLIKSHARAWHIYNDNFKPTQGGQVGFSIDSQWFEPMFPNQIDIDSAERALQFKMGWFAHPIYSDQGDYPTVMKEFIGNHSAQEGFPESRLPVFDAFWLDYVKGAFDFMGLNHYGTSWAAYADVFGTPPNYDNDMNVWQATDPAYPYGVCPWGFRKLLNWIKDQYGNKRLIVTENGFSQNDGSLNDDTRITNFRNYIDEMLKAVNVDGCNVFGYTAWSLLDVFEWNSGYDQKFGFYQVDFNNPALPRTQKDSGKFYNQLIIDNGFPAPADKV